MPDNGTKYDWFKNELVGNTANFADIYQDGKMPENFAVKDVDSYWNDEAIRKPFEEKYGAEQGKQEFDKLYKNSVDRLDAYKKGRFDIASTSTKRLLPNAYNKRLAEQGLAKVYNNPSVQVADIPQNFEGRDIVAGMYSRPEYSFREGAFDNGVLVDGKLVDYDTFRDTDDRAVVYGVDEESQPLFHEGKTYLRPLEEGEEKKANEEYATKFSDYMGFNGLDTPDWYALKFAPKNVANFAADVLDSGAELFKSIDRVTMSREDEPSEFYRSLSEFQNTVGKYLHGSTSDAGMQSWTSVEGLVDGVSQVVLQLGGMYGVATGTRGLLSVAKMASEAGATRAASVASRMFMGTLAADGLAKEAQAAGLSPRETAAIHALSLLGYYKISRLSEWVIGTNPAMQKYVTQSVLKRGLDKIQKAVEQTGKLNTKGLYQAARGMVKDLDTAVRNTLVNPNAFAGYIAAGATESMEEVSESLMELGIKEAYNRIYQPVLGSTVIGSTVETDTDKRFNVDYTTLASELAQAATLGFVGGTIGRTFFRGGNEQKNYYKYLATGQFGQLKSELDKMHKRGGLADPSVNAMGNTVQEGEDSRNDIAYKAIINDLKVAEFIWNSKGLNNAYSNNEQKLAAISNADLKDTSIGNDIAETLSEIDTLKEENQRLSADTSADASTTEKIKDNEKKIESLNTELNEIVKGRRVTKYMQEAMYNVDRPFTPFKRYYGLNEEVRKTMESRTTMEENLKKSEAATIDTIEDFPVLTPEVGERLKSELNTALAEEGGSKKYDPKFQTTFKATVDEKVKKGKDLPDPLTEMRMDFGPDFKSTTSFERIIASEIEKLEQLEKSGEGVYDNLEVLSNLRNNLENRIDHLTKSISINPEINIAYQKLEEEKKEYEISPEDAKVLAKEYDSFRKAIDKLITISKANRDNFDQAVEDANKKGIDAQVDQLSKAVNDLSSAGTLFSGPIADEIDADLIAIQNVDDYTKKQAQLYRTQKKLHNFFVKDKDPQVALDILYDNYEISSNESALKSRVAFKQNLGVFRDQVRPSTLKYLKTIITLDPEVFLSHYGSIVDNIPETESNEKSFTKARHILSPSQRSVAQQITAFLEDVTTSSLDRITFDSKSQDFPITQGIYYTSWQGSGKTITASTAARTRQKISGGKILVVANDTENHKNMLDTLEGLNADIDKTSLTSFAGLLSHLKSDKQGEITTIIYDEATLLKASQVYELDLKLKALNNSRSGPKLKVIYVGDKSQIGAKSSTGEGDFNVTNTFIETTPEIKFSYRTGNDQINKALEHLRAIMDARNEGVAFSTMYDMESLSGARFEDADFDKALAATMDKMTSEHNYVVIAEEDRIGNLRQKYNIPTERIMTPEQAQGKQWDYVIVDLETAKIIGPSDQRRKKRLLSAVGRAKQFVLARIDNTPNQGVSRNITSDKGTTSNVESTISEESRLKAKEQEIEMIKSLSLPDLTESDFKGSQGIYTFAETTPVEVVSEVKSKPLSIEQRTAIDNIINKINDFPRRKGTTSDKAYVMQHGFYSYAESYDADGNRQTLTDQGEILALKRKLLLPDDSVDIKASFSLMVHGDELPSRIITEDPSKFNPKTKKFVIYATIYENDKPTHKISMGALNNPSDFGLSQSDLFNVEIAFTPEQNQKYLSSIRTSRAMIDLDISEEEKAESVILEAPSYTTRKFSLKGEETRADEFVEVNSNMWNFASRLIYTTQPGKEKQPWLVYSPTKTSQELDEIIQFSQKEIDAEGTDVKKIAVDGGRVMSTEEAFDRITEYYDTEVALRPQKRHILPEISHTSRDAIFTMMFDKIKMEGQYNSKKDSIFSVYNNIRKKRSKKTTKNLEEKLLLDAMYTGFFDKTGRGKRRSGKLNVKRTGKRSVQYRFERPPIEEENIRFSVNKALNYLNRRSNNRNANVAKAAQKSIDAILKQAFPNGFYYSIEAATDETSSREDTYAVSNAELENFTIKNMRHPAMPVHKIKFDFFKDVLSNDEILSTKIKTRTDFESLEEASSRKAEEVKKDVVDGKAPASPLSIEKLILGKNVEGNERSVDAEQFAALTGQVRTNASMFDIFYTWFNQKPFNHKFERFAEYYTRKIYNSVFHLTGNTPRIVENEELHKTLTDMRKALSENGKIIDDSVNAIVENQTGYLNRKSLLENDAHAQVYYDYIISKEFDTLLELKFPYIKFDKASKRYVFDQEQYIENQLVDNKEKVSHIERGNNLVKMHLFNMPIYSRELVNGREVFVFKRFGDQRIIAKLVKAIRDENITDITKARAFFSRSKDDPEMYSFFKRFLDDSPYRAMNTKDGGFETTHSFASLNNDISEDTVTGILSFLASGNETEYATIDLAENELNVKFINIAGNMFRTDLEMAIKSIESAPVDKVNNDTYKIYYGKTGRDFITVSKSGDYTFSNGKTTDIGKVLTALSLPTINTSSSNSQHEEVLNIQTRGGTPLTGNILFEIAQFLSKPKGKRDVLFQGASLTNWITWSDEFQNIKQFDSAYGYTNLAGDKVNLISLSYPLVRTNQRIRDIRNNPNALKNNPYIKDDLTIDAFLLKEGYKGRRNSRANKKMTVNEQMDFDFKHLYIKSLLKPRKEGKRRQSVVFNPLVFADKTSDSALRVSGQFMPVTEKGEIDIQFLKKRAINTISDYNTELGIRMARTFIEAFDEVDIKHNISPLRDGSSPETVKARLQQIKAFVDKLAKKNQAKANLLTRTPLVHQLMYQTEGGNVVGGIKQGFINSIVYDDVADQMDQAYNLAKKQYGKRISLIPQSAIRGINNAYGVTTNENQLFDSYFYNHNYVAQSYSTMMVGSIWQYKDSQEFGDQIKRASQLTTNRQKFILRRDGYDPNIHTIKHGRKLGKTSKTAILKDIRVPLQAINYQGKYSQEVFDGAAFHNIYAMLQMKESYGNNLGFNVAPTIKPISNYVDESIGHSRFDKYASFLLSPEILRDGDPFIKKINELMLKSVDFEADVIRDSNGNPLIYSTEKITIVDSETQIDAINNYTPKNLYELERAVADANGLDINENYPQVAALTLDVMVANGLQDNYLQEVIFDSSVKTGISNLNSVGSFDDIQRIERLKYMERGNQERGLILDASHDPSTHEGAFPTQIVSAVLQGNFAVEESNNILRAIEILGNKERENILKGDVNAFSREQLRERINKRGDIGLIHQIVNRPKFSPNNKTIMGQLFSALATKVSDLTIGIKIKGGQQVVGPSYGVFNHPTENRPLRGFDAFDSLNNSIKKEDAWNRLVDLVNNDESPQLIQEARAEVHELLRTQYTRVQKPEVIIAPTMLKDFNIPINTKLEDIEIGFAQGLYKGTYEDFKKTLEMVVLRIPATNKQSFMAVDVVGFSYDSENTFYTNLDLLYFQGADQDIDKGNLLTFEADKEGKIVVPKDNEISEDTDIVHLKNYIVQQFINASTKSDTLMESTMPTSTATLKDLAKDYIKIEDANVHYMNPFSLSTMFVRGQGGKTNISIHANGLKTYSSVYHSLRKNKDTGLQSYQAKSETLGYAIAQVKGIQDGDELGYFETMSFFSELINAAVDNAKDPILGALGINSTTGNLVNAFAILGYSPKQVVDFLHVPSVQAVINEFEEYHEFSTEYKAFKSLGDFAREHLRKNKSSELADLVAFSDFAEEFALLGQALAINREAPNSPYDYYRFSTNLNLYLDGITTVEQFANASPAQRQQFVQEVYDSGKKVNVLQVLNDNENFLSYLKSATMVHNEMSKEGGSITYKTVDVLGRRAAEQLDRPINDKFYKDITNFVYGMAVDEYLSQNDGTTVKLTIGGITKTYNLGKVKGAKGTGERGRIEFMQDFPAYFKHELEPRGQNTLQHYMTVEILGRPAKEIQQEGEIKKELDETMPVLKLIGDFRAQSPEKKVSMMSAMQMLEESPNNQPDLGIATDTNVKQLLFFYSLIKDKGGNSPTSYTALFDYSDFEEFDSFLDSWESSYNLNDPDEVDSLLEQIKAMSTNAPNSITGTIEIHPKHRFAIPYKNDKTANDASDVSQDITPIREKKVDTNPGLIAAIKEGYDIIYTTLAESGEKATKFRIEKALGDAGYILDKTKSTKGNFMWVKSGEPARKRSNIIRVSPTTYNVLEDDDQQTFSDQSNLNDDSDMPSSGQETDPPPWSSFDFEEAEKRVHYSKVTNTKVLEGIASIISSNTGVNIKVLSSSQISEQYGKKFSYLRGFVANDGTPVVNANMNNLDVPMHEMGHLWVKALRGSNPELYSRIIEEVSEHEMMDRVAEQYPELQQNALAEEVFSTLFGLSQQNKALSSYNRNFLTRMRDTMIEFLEWLRNAFNDIFGIEANTDDTLIGIMNKVGDRMLSSSYFNLSNADIQTLTTMGVQSSPLTIELREIQNSLRRKGLMEMNC